MLKSAFLKVEENCALKMLIGNSIGNQIFIHWFTQEATSTKIKNCLLPLDVSKFKKKFILECQVNRKEEGNCQINAMSIIFSYRSISITEACNILKKAVFLKVWLNGPIQ